MRVERLRHLLYPIMYTLCKAHKGGVDDDVLKQLMGDLSDALQSLPLTGDGLRKLLKQVVENIVEGSSQ